MTDIQESTTNAPIRIGIIYGPLRDLNTTIVSYLLTHLNTLQSSFEYEILPSYPNVRNIKDAIKTNPFVPDIMEDPFIKVLDGSSQHNNDYENLFNSERAGFISRYKKIVKDNYRFEMKEPLPESYILISTAILPQNRYFLYEENLALLSLATWESSMAPPSVIESIITLVVRASVSIACPGVLEEVHLSTKGCLFDFDPELVNTRYKVLNGIICSYCSTAMTKAGQNRMIDDIRLVLREQEWLGTLDNPFSPVSIIAKMGYDLFLTRGLKPGFWETLRANIVKEVTKEIIRVAGAIILAGLLIWFGLQQA